MIGALCCAVLMLVLEGCENRSTIQVMPEEWETMSPGQPLAKFPTAKVIEEGKGAAVEVGQLVKVNLSSKWGGEWHDFGNWWIWTGFLERKETPFFSNSPRIASALIGMREGTSIEFIDAHDDPMKDPDLAGTLYTNVVGDQPTYFWRKNLENDTHGVTVFSQDRGAKIKILVTCKAVLQRRSVHLYDDRSRTEPEELWFDEGRVQGKCSDGHTATFRYGPSKSKRNDKLSPSALSSKFDQWIYEEWMRLPTGVQIDNNRPIVVPRKAQAGKVTTRVDTPVKINFFDASDPGNDPLMARISGGPSHGKLTVNSDGNYTYTPDKGWKGIDEFFCRASNGRRESEPGIWEVTVR